VEKKGLSTLRGHQEGGGWQEKPKPETTLFEKSSDYPERKKDKRKGATSRCDIYPRKNITNSHEFRHEGLALDRKPAEGERKGKNLGWTKNF